MNDHIHNAISNKIITKCIKRKESKTDNKVNKEMVSIFPEGEN